MKTKDICDYGVCVCSCMPDTCLAGATSGVPSIILSVYLSIYLWLTFLRGAGFFIIRQSRNSVSQRQLIFRGEWKRWRWGVMNKSLSISSLSSAGLKPRCSNWWHLTSANELDNWWNSKWFHVISNSYAHARSRSFPSPLRTGTFILAVV